MKQTDDYIMLPSYLDDLWAMLEQYTPEEIKADIDRLVKEREATKP